jgi:hypothetical protein
VNFANTFLMVAEGKTFFNKPPFRKVTKGIRSDVRTDKPLGREALKLQMGCLKKIATVERKSIKNAAALCYATRS